VWGSKQRTIDLLTEHRLGLLGAIIADMGLPVDLAKELAS